jgi:general secretion pathway protein D
MPHRPAVLLLFAITFALAGAPAVDAAETITETKIRLLSEALRARDSGNVIDARVRLEELLRLAPGDATVGRLLASLEQNGAKTVSVSGGVTLPTPGEAQRLAREEEQRLARAVEAANRQVRDARALAAERQFGAALDLLQRVRGTLGENSLTQPILTEIDIARAQIATERDEHLASITAAAQRDATATLPAAVAEAPVIRASANVPPPTRPDVRGEVLALIARGRSQFLAGEPAAAAQTFARVLEIDPANEEADQFLRRIARSSVDGNADRARTSAQMLNEVARAWQRPGVYQEPPPGAAVASGPSPLLEKLNRIVLPSVNFHGLELSRVVHTLSVVSEEFDATGTDPKGVNVVIVDPTNSNPSVSITLRNLSLKRVLDFITDSVGYQYEVQADAVVIRPGGEQSALDTQFYPVSRSTVLRMTGRGTQGNAGGTLDPLAGGAATGNLPQSIDGEGKAIRNFLQLAGVNFDQVDGSTLAFDGSQLIVTQTGRNLDRIRNILARYSEVRQVEIEAKFMEVQDGALEELGVNWNIGKKAAQQSGASVTNYVTGNRSLAGAFSSNAGGSQGAIVRPAVPPVFNDANGDGAPQPGEIATPGIDGLNIPIFNNAPFIPGTNNLGQSANPLATITGILGEFNVNAVIRALSQRSGTELLSAPKLTVLSGNPATITVAQELRYPQSYGQVQSQVGTGNASGGGSAGVTITAGTPQEFTTRNVGVELRVTPTVEEDDYSISLDLNPKVTEFEGFVEYGGQSVAVSGSTTVTVPSGFYQPIFAIREVSTKVTIWDGATLVMGGLTREDTRKTNDKVPVIGNLPVLGRLFRSSGESAQKRNLLIFVTANLVSPGGSLKKQTVEGVPAGTIFQNPTIVTPAGAAGRVSGNR